MGKKIRALSTATAVSVIICIFAGIFSGCSVNDKKTEFPTATDKFFINDFADVMSDTAEEKIYSEGVALQKKTTAQAVVVTVDNVGDYEMWEYALELGRKWGIGTEKDDNGILILLSVSDREVYIAVGYGLEGALPDSKTGRILDTYGVPYFSEDNFSDGLLAVYKAVVNEVYTEYGTEPEESYIQIDDYADTQKSGSGKVILSWAALVLIVMLYLFVSKKRGLFLFGGFPFRGGFNSHNGFNNHGGFHGGHGGGFSGGGGSFGGGGAGRKF